MEIRIRGDSVEIEGYVNAVERNSKPLYSRIGRFLERICKGAFQRAIDRANNVECMLNHERVVGGIKEGNLKLYEDSIGLRAKLITDDAEVVKDAREGNLVGWSFGFYDVPDGVEQRTEDGLPLRVVKDMDLREVSIINRKKSPAYEGTLIMARSDDDVQFYGDVMQTEINVREESVETETIRSQQDESSVDDKAIDYSKYEAMISEMKGEMSE